MNDRKLRLMSQLYFSLRDDAIVACRLAGTDLSNDRWLRECRLVGRQAVAICEQASALRDQTRV